MVIIYKGKDKKLTEEFNEYKDRLNQKYVEIFGRERADRIESVVNRTISEKTFFDDVDELNTYFGGGIEKNTSNKFGLIVPSTLEISNDGKVKTRKVNTSLIFYVSEEGFKHSGSSRFTDKVIASYVHEFDHFIWYALQKQPLYLVSHFLTDKIKPRKTPVDLEDLMQQTIEEKLSLNEITERFKFATLAYTLDDIYEKANKILDRMVLSSIGIDVPLDWRGKERTYQQFPIPPKTLIMMGHGGDPFKNIEDSEVINRFINWQEYGNPTFRNLPYAINLIESIKDLKVSRLPIDELERVVERKNKKKK